jgi:hypothetical protein
MYEDESIIRDLANYTRDQAANKEVVNCEKHNIYKNMLLLLCI